MPASLAEAKCRHARYYLEVVKNTDTVYLQPDGAREALSLFDRERRNIESAYAWAAAQSSSDGRAAFICSKLAYKGAYVLNARLSADQRINWFNRAVSAAILCKDGREEGAHLGNLGLAYQRLGDAKAAIEYLERSLAVARAIPDLRMQAELAGALGSVYRDQLNDARSSLPHSLTALRLAEEIGDRRTEATAAACLSLPETHPL